ncbi:DNA translocase FtsK [Kaistia dalseonensis]|uniref:DNA translocase FtsK n=1 Tax=Kaistia dalseonensis TaxID=410840 RepID=A0ABU0H4R3_9HYPH|nr:DNA translocase FtsK [Kaistia dalseonensis]MCX5494721.1 DNA translocase FtsK [Kaistia dalseonensis]MDQ0437302.1 S-DNA-T family DNA segregation ATPase FtsK/SpoIIIE [Kaistia dalseonensis]
MRSTRSVSLPMPSDDGEGLSRLLRRHVGLVIGVALLAGAAAIAASLVTWTVDDPSLSYAAAKPVVNILGFPGAIISDLLMQFFGLAAAVLLLPAVFWGWRGLFGGRSFRGMMIASWLAAPLAAAASLSYVPVTAHWPLPTGLGGVLGDVLGRIPNLVLGGPPTGNAATIAPALFALLSFALLLHAAGFVRLGRRDDERPARENAPRPAAKRQREVEPDDVDAFDDDERGSFFAVPLGALAHWGYSARASVGRLFRRHDDEDDVPVRPVGGREPSVDGGRREPRMVPRSVAPRGGAMPEAALDDEDDEDDDQLSPLPSARVSAPAPRPKAGKRLAQDAQPSLLKNESFELPALQFLAEPRAVDPRAKINLEALEQNARVLEGVLDDFGIRGEIINVRPGPVVTLYELEPAPGIKSSRVIGLADDIARSMSAIAARVAVIPGKNAIGIELPNARREMVFLRELLAAEDFEKSKARLPMCLGKTIGGEPVIADLARMPHLLVAGTTGSGKSVAINTMILSLLYRLRPDECRLIMIDPKMLELSIYDGIPHLLTPVVTDPKKAVVALKWTVREMEDRYRKMSKVGVRNIDGYNARVGQAKARGEVLTRTIQTGFDKETGEAVYEQEDLPLEPIPYIVVLIDEMADLMMVAGKDIEGAVQRLAQMARAAGIHVIMATQRPSVDVITGTIKANFPTRISFQVTSKIDSRTILGEMGAEQLLGQGDMLYMAGGGRIQRVHGPFVSDEEVERIVKHLKTQGHPDYLDSITEDDGETEEGGEAGGPILGGEESNDLYDKAVAVVLRDRKASTSYIQRRLSIGYNRAASLIERMEKEGLVGPANHAGKREILVGGEDEGRF